VGSASSAFLAVTALSLVTASTMTAGRSGEDDRTSEVPKPALVILSLRGAENEKETLVKAFQTDWTHTETHGLPGSETGRLH
jgi:hypothetical protein